MQLCLGVISFISQIPFLMLRACGVVVVLLLNYCCSVIVVSVVWLVLMVLLLLLMRCHLGDALFLVVLRN